MTGDLFLALAVFALVSLVTPGPNNLMLMTSGVNFGFQRTLPHLLGVALGFSLMVLLVGLGLAGLFLAEPRAVLGLQMASVAYMLWLAWKIAHAAPPAEGTAGGAPISFLQAAAFQWVNPKAWAMALTATSVYAPAQTVAAMLTVAVVFFVMGLPCLVLWVALGQGMRRFLTVPRVLRLFNLSMAVLLVASLWPVLQM